MVLMIAPISIQVMENFGLPSARARLLIPLLTIRNGIPIAVIRVYSLAYGMISAVAPNAVSSGTRKISISTA